MSIVQREISWRISRNPFQIEAVDIAANISDPSNQGEDIVSENHISAVPQSIFSWFQALSAFVDTSRSQ